MLTENAIGQGAVMVVCTLLGGLGTKLIEAVGTAIKIKYDTKANEDKLKYDLRIVALETAVTECKNKHTECEDAHRVSIAEIDKLRAEMKERDAHDKAEMLAQIAQLRAQRETDHG